jgi:hypothetical protein
MSETVTVKYGDTITEDYRERDNGATQLIRRTYHATGLIKVWVRRNGQQIKFFSNNPGTAVVGREKNGK